MKQRKFIPGSQWLYFKLYTGHKTADVLLTKVVNPLVSDLQTRILIDRWFFIRYNDPDFHLRLRIHIPKTTNYGEIMTAFHLSLLPCVEDGRVQKIQCDTYVREIERYGHDTIEQLEEIFCVDSAVQVELLTHLMEQPGDVRENLRGVLALKLLDDALTGFGYDLEAKCRLMEQMADNFKQEFGFTHHSYTKQLNSKYRTARPDIERVLTSCVGIETFIDILNKRKQHFAKIAQQINGAVQTALDGIVSTISTDALMRSIEHMTVNRWFRSRNRQHELVIYDFLTKFYKSELAKAKLKA